MVKEANRGQLECLFIPEVRGLDPITCCEALQPELSRLGISSAHRSGRNQNSARRELEENFMTLPAEIEAEIRRSFAPEDWEGARQMALQQMDPQRRDRLHKPLLATLVGVLNAQIEMSKRSGDELTPADITDVLATVLASHVASTANPRVQAGDITLEIGKLVTQRLHRMLTSTRRPS